MCISSLEGVCPLGLDTLAAELVYDPDLENHRETVLLLCLGLAQSAVSRLYIRRIMRFSQHRRAKNWKDLVPGYILSMAFSQLFQLGQCVQDIWGRPGAHSEQSRGTSRGSR